MPDRGTGNEVQSRAVLEQIADAAVAKYALANPQPERSPEPVKAEIPAPLKWAAAVVAALLTLGVTGSVTWGVSTLNDLQITVARMDERMQRDETGKRLDKIEERLGKLERGKAAE